MLSSICLAFLGFGLSWDCCWHVYVLPSQPPQRPPLSLTHRHHPARSYKACYTTGYDFDVKLNPKTWGNR